MTSKKIVTFPEEIKPESESSRVSSKTNKDKIFAEPKSKTYDFEFGKETAEVFDDMVGRSVPFYDEIQRMTCELAAEFAVPGSSLFDMGCATGTTLLALDPLVDPDVRFVGLDNSEEMLSKARDKLEPVARRRKLDLVRADINTSTVVEDASVVVLLLTLQFVRPLVRAKAVHRMCEGLRENGCLLLVEKVTGAHSLLNRLFIDCYYRYKRRKGYSDLEIAQKREALENVMVPYHHEENCDLLREAGFHYVEEFFRWYNFTGVIAVK